MIRARTLLILLVWIAPIAPAQTPGERPGAPGRLFEKDLDEERLRQRLERMLEFSERMNERVTEALAMLDEGASADEVLRSIRAPGLERAWRGERAGAMGDPGPAPPSDEVDPDRLEEARAFIAENLPGIDAPLSKIEALGPNAGRGLLLRLAPRVLEVIDTRAYDPVLGDLKLEELRAGLDFVEATRRYRQARRAGIENGDDLARLESDLHDAATRRFDAQVAIKKHEVRQLMDRLESLSMDLDALIGDRDARIEAQIDAATSLPLRGRLEGRPRRGDDGG